MNEEEREAEDVPQGVLRFPLRESSSGPLSQRQREIEISVAALSGAAPQKSGL